MRVPLIKHIWKWSHSKQHGCWVLPWKNWFVLDTTDLNFQGTSVKKKYEKQGGGGDNEAMSYGTQRGKLHIPQPPDTEMHLVLSEDLIKH